MRYEEYFTGWDRKHGFKDVRQFCEEVLIKLARQRRLSLTEIRNIQEPPLRNMISYILHGVAIQDKRMVSEDIPEEIIAYRVKLRRVNGNSPLHYKAGWDKSAKKYKGKIHQGKSKWAILNFAEDGTAMVSIPTATKVLTMWGKNFRYGGSDLNRETNWLVEEVPQEPVICELTPEEKLAALAAKLGPAEIDKLIKLAGAK